MKSKVLPIASYEVQSVAYYQVRREKCCLLTGMKSKVLPIARYEEQRGPDYQVLFKSWSLLPHVKSGLKEEAVSVFRYEELAQGVPLVLDIT